MHHTQSEHTPVGVPTEVIRDHHDKDGSNNKRHKALSCKSKNNCNVNKRQEQQKKMDGQKYQQQQKGRRRSAGRGGGHQATRTRRGRGDWKDLNQVSQTVGWACQDRYQQPSALLGAAETSRYVMLLLLFHSVCVSCGLSN